VRQGWREPAPLGFQAHEACHAVRYTGFRTSRARRIVRHVQRAADEWPAARPVRHKPCPTVMTWRC